MDLDRYWGRHCASRYVSEMPSVNRAYGGQDRGRYWRRHDASATVAAATACRQHRPYVYMCLVLGWGGGEGQKGSAWGDCSTDRGQAQTERQTDRQID